MGSNRFGQILTMTTWGESHGRGIGVVVDGCPAGISLCVEDIEKELFLRRPGNNPYTSPRGEKDQPEILSGLFEGQTTGAPISIFIANEDADPSKYEPIKNSLRPGHANFTYLEKYGLFDYRGGGRASARETAARVAAGAVAKKILDRFGVRTLSYISSVGPITISSDENDFEMLVQHVRQSAIFCPDAEAEKEIKAAIEQVKKEGDSLGAVVTCQCRGVPVGLGDPVYEKLEANLAKAMMGLPATKGFEIGEGFAAARMKGSQHNDLFALDAEGEVVTTSQHAGGTLGGISNGMPLLFRVAFKPTSSIRQPQTTLTTDKKETILQLPEGSRHDPCVALRAPPIVDAMAAWVLADALLMNRSARI